MGKPIINEIGNVHGRLIGEYFAGTKNGQALWGCRCEDGNLIVVPGKLLRNGRVRSCGCLRPDVLKGPAFRATCRSNMKARWARRDFRKMMLTQIRKADNRERIIEGLQKYWATIPAEERWRLMHKHCIKWGSNHGLSKLTLECVIFIRAILLKERNLSCSKIATILSATEQIQLRGGVTHTAIRKIKKGQTWRGRLPRDLTKLASQAVDIILAERRLHA